MSRSLPVIRKALAFATLTFSSAALAAEGPPGHTHEYAAVGQPAKPTASSRSVQVTLVDMAFEPETINVKSGETVRFVVTNKGQLLHEFNLGTPAMHAEHQKEMAMMMDHGMITATGIDEHMMKMDMGGHQMTHDDPNSVLVPPGETRELTWKFTKDAEIEFACNIPGHYEAGMVGKIERSR
ncbi:MAG: plastocyanin/azurin family copper-binding protein [Gemmatimonas sp.]